MGLALQQIAVPADCDPLPVSFTVPIVREDRKPPRWIETGRGRVRAMGGLRPFLKLPRQNQNDSDFGGVTTELF